MGARAHTALCARNAQQAAWIWRQWLKQARTTRAHQLCARMPDERGRRVGAKGLASPRAGWHPQAATQQILINSSSNLLTRPPPGPPIPSAPSLVH
eukprot:6706368-Prymnesium_polylepis.2